jgi:hypothetical protein
MTADDHTIVSAFHNAVQDARAGSLDDLPAMAAIIRWSASPEFGKWRGMLPTLYGEDPAMALAYLLRYRLTGRFR